MTDISDLLEEYKDRVFVELPAGLGNIPCICVNGRSLAQAWELSLLALYRYGTDIRTEYDAKDAEGRYIEPPSKDCSIRIVIADPSSEPLIHRCIPGGLEDLEEYRQEVCLGIKDHWVRDLTDPNDQRWEYTYHERLFRYSVPGLEKTFDQIQAVIEGLAKSPISRRFQAITWKAWEDNGIHDPPCLQSIWFRVLPDPDDVWHLNMNVRFRSRDAYDAAYMNCFAFIHLQEMVARGIAERAGREVRLGRYIDESDSYHIYGSRLADFENRFLVQVKGRSFEQRTWTREFAEPFFEQARPAIEKKIKEYDNR